MKLLEKIAFQSAMIAGKMEALQEIAPDTFSKSITNLKVDFQNFESDIKRLSDSVSFLFDYDSRTLKDDTIGSLMCVISSVNANDIEAYRGDLIGAFGYMERSAKSIETLEYEE